MPVRRLKRKTQSSTARQSIGSREEGERGGKETTDESLEQTQSAKEESQGETSPDTASSFTALLSSSRDEQEQSDSKEPKVVLMKLRPRKPRDIPLVKYCGIMTRSRAKTTPTSPESDQDPFTLDTAPPPHKKAREDVPAPGGSGELARSQVGKEAALKRKGKDQDVGVAAGDKSADDTVITGGEGGGGPCEGTEEEGIDLGPGDGGGCSVERPRKYWLMKSEPESRVVKGVDVKFGIEELENEEQQTACWDGVRNYQVRVRQARIS